MVQLYFLSIICNSISGYILFTGGETDGYDSEKGFGSLIRNPTFHLVLGILSVVTGILKLLSPIMNKTPFFGDLIPAAAGVVSGMILIFGIYRRGNNAAPDSANSLDRIGQNLLRFRKSLGIGLIAAALVHFLFPTALFL